MTPAQLSAITYACLAAAQAQVQKARATGATQMQIPREELAGVLLLAMLGLVASCDDVEGDALVEVAKQWERDMREHQAQTGSDT